MKQPANSIHIVPSFHYDVAYLKPYAEYLPQCFANIDEAIRIFDVEPDYRYLLEQVILFEDYWKRFPEKREKLRALANAARLGISPGQYVMPDLNHPNGETLFLQAKFGKQWLAEHGFTVEPNVCYIADCWGHPASLPQIMTQCGYDYYVFYRTMRRDVLKQEFLWQGIDGTQIKTHWLAQSYSAARFPSNVEAANVLELNYAGFGPEQVGAWLTNLARFGGGNNGAGPIMITNSGDMLLPQATAPAVVRTLNATRQLPPIQFSTLADYLKEIRWDGKPVVEGEFNSSFQGSFTTHVRIKQLNRQLSNRMHALEALAVISGAERTDYSRLWKLVLKQQFHDIICGSITDSAVEDCFREYAEAESGIGEAMGEGDTLFNPLSFERTEIVEHRGRRVKVTLPAFALLHPAAGKEISPINPLPELPATFESPFYRASVDARGFIVSLIEKQSGQEVVRSEPCHFGAITMQMDAGDAWLNFEGPIDGGSWESALDQNGADPFDRNIPRGLANRGTFQPVIASAKVLTASAEELIIEQRGSLKFWTIEVPFVTRVRFVQHSPRIEYEMTLVPKGKHFRLRAAFPTAISQGTRRDEVQFGFQVRGGGEHVAQNWFDWADERKGLAVLNRGTPAGNVHDGVLLLTLFRSVAIEYKTKSVMMFQEGVEQRFEYAVVPHATKDLVTVVREGHAFNCPLVNCDAAAGEGSFGVDAKNVFVSGLRQGVKEGEIFVRVYEAVGEPTNAVLKVPGRFKEWAMADGLERVKGEFRKIDGAGIGMELRGFEIIGVVVR